MLSLSILIPFYNSSDYLLRLLKSIYKAYSKDIIDYEIIVCIDSMFDTPLSISTLLNNSFNHEFISKIIIIKNKENLGVAKSRNELYFKSNKEYLIFIDQDDEIRNDFFLKVNSIYDKTRFDFLLNNALIVESQTGLKHKYYYQKPSLNIKDLITDTIIRTPGQVIIKKSLMEYVQFPIPKCHQGCDDYFFWILLFMKNTNMKIFYNKEAIFIYNLHESNFSNDSNVIYKCCEELLVEIKKYPESIKYKKEINAISNRVNYILGTDTSLLNFIGYIRYKIKPYKLSRYVIKECLRLFLNPTNILHNNN